MVVVLHGVLKCEIVDCWDMYSSIFLWNAISLLDGCCQSVIVAPNVGLVGFLETAPAPHCHFLGQ